MKTAKLTSLLAIAGGMTLATGACGQANCNAASCSAMVDGVADNCAGANCNAKASDVANCAASGSKAKPCAAVKD